MKVKIINKSKNELPSYSTPNSAGMDVRADVPGPVLIKPLERKLIPTGLFIELPVGVECQVRPRSGLAIKNGITVLNSPGTIDSDYRGNVGVILVNLSNLNFYVLPGDRIAQLVFTEHEHAEWELTDELGETGRSGGGFGHTGVK